MTEKKKSFALGWVMTGFMLIFFITITWSDIMNGEFFSKGNLIMLVICLGAVFQLFTWRNDERAKKDEMGRHIVNRSSVIGYRLLTLVLFILWVTDRYLYDRSNEFGNVFLFIGVCLSLVLLPILQLIISKKYQ